MRRFGFYCLVILLFVIVRQGEARLIRDYSIFGAQYPAQPSSVLDDPEGGEISYGQYAFSEKSGTLLSDDLAVDGGTIPAGTVVDSHMIFLNTEEGSLGASDLGVVWKFDGVVLGVMSDIDGSLEVDSNPLLGYPDTIYPEDSFSGRGLEHHGDGTSEEGYTVSGNTITLGMDTTDNGDPGDWIRVITKPPIHAQIGIEPDALKLKRKINPNEEEEFTVLIDLPGGADKIDIDTIYIYIEAWESPNELWFCVGMTVLSGVIDDDGRLAVKVDKLALIALGEGIHGKGFAHFYVFGGGLTDGRMFRFVGSDMVDLKIRSKLAPAKQRKVNSKSSTWGSIKAK